MNPLLRLKWLHIIPFNSELEWSWLVSEQWNVMGNYAWQHATNKQANQPVKGVPEHHVYFAFQWHFMPKWQLQPQINWIGGRINPIAANERWVITKPLI